MKRIMALTVACLLGGLLVAALLGGLRGRVQAAPSAGALDVVINEVAWMGTNASGYDEWIELYNNTDQDIDLTGWTLTTDDGTPTINLTGTISAHDYYLLERTNDDTVSGTAAAQIYSGDLLVGGEVLTLTDDTPSVVDTANAENGVAWPGGTNNPDYTMERIDPTASDTDDNWCTNDGVTRSGLDASGDPINGTPKAQNSCYAVAGLALAKEGPSIATAGLTLTCRLLVSNTAASSIAGVIVTDVLPSELTFVTQASAFAFERLEPDVLRWDVGGLAGGALHLVTLTLRVAEGISGTVTNVATTTEQSGRTERASWEAPLVPHVRLYALAPANYGGSGEAAALINLSPYTASVDGWWLNDEASAGGILLLSGTAIEPDELFWLAEDADGFREVWGFDADRASSVHWPGFTDDGEAAYLLDGDGHVIDALAYGDGVASTGWSAPPVPYKYADYGDGQVLYRKLDQATGLPVSDTDAAADWAQDPDDPINGRRLRYPGWDVERFFFPAVSTSTAPITLAAAPDGAFELVSETLASARESILLEGYTFESAALYEVLEDRLQAGVAITLLLEGSPASWFGEDRKNGLWIAEQIHEHANGAAAFMVGDAPRYRYQHAKFAVVDGETALVSTENFNPSAMPSDRKGNGTMGHRGFVAVVDSQPVVGRLQAIFDLDRDLAHHVDLVPYGTGSLELDDPGFIPLPELDWTTYTAAFSQPLAAMGSDLTVIQAPENALRDRDALLGLLRRAGSGDAVTTMQLDEPYTWTAEAVEAGVNPRLQALVAAAQDGAEVRLLLDDFYDDGGNETTCRVLNDIAAEEALSLTCRLGNPTGSGLHAKTFLASVGGERWVHLGSINGTENSNKRNREAALQFRSPAAYGWMLSVFEHDWAQAHAPYVAHVYLPVVMRGYILPVDYPLVSEVFINPGGSDTGGEWIELYNPGDAANLAGWMLGDAVDAVDYGDGRYVFPGGAQLLHGQVMVVAQCARVFAEAQGQNPQYELAICPAGYADDGVVPNLEPAAAWEGFGLALGNVEDEVLLMGADGAVVDGAAWGSQGRAGMLPYPMDPGDTFPWDVSLKRYPADADSDDCSRDFYVSYNPSPGAVASD